MENVVRLKDCVFDANAFIKFWIEETRQGQKDWVLLGVPRGLDKGIMLARFKTRDEATGVLEGIWKAAA